MADEIPVNGFPDTYTNTQFGKKVIGEVKSALVREGELEMGRNFWGQWTGFVETKPLTVTLPFGPKLVRSGSRAVEWELDSAVEGRTLRYVVENSNLRQDKKGNYAGYRLYFVDGTVEGVPVVENLQEYISGSVTFNNSLDDLSVKLGIKNVGAYQQERRKIKSGGYIPVDKIEPLIAAIIKRKDFQWEDDNSKVFLGIGIYTYDGDRYPPVNTRHIRIESKVTNDNIQGTGEFIGLSGATGIDNVAGEIMEAMAFPKAGMESAEFYVNPTLKVKRAKSALEKMMIPMENAIYLDGGPDAAYHFLRFSEEVARGKVKPTIIGYSWLIKRIKGEN